MIEDANYLLTESIELIERYGTYLLSDSSCDVNEEWKTLSPVMMCMCDVKEKYSASERVFNECLDKIGASENQNVDMFLNVLSTTFSVLFLSFYS